ncbi:MAG: sigma-70 family RNA polymerase sigma factor [Deltaproteobacteria bacterium]|nr:sigma-70 family RNA polymerase sigma factor [Deltaproteobacteria bacterium]
MLGKARKLRSDFEREVLPHADALWGTALRLTRNERDAEDLVQEALLRAYRFFHRFEQGSNCKAWLFKILTNTFITRYHKERRLQETALTAAQEDALTEDILSHEVSHSARDPEGALAQRMLSDDVQRALESIPEEFRLAVILCDVEEFSYKEIADILDCPIGTVMSRLYRGRRLLARALHDYAVELGIINPVQAAQSTGEPPIDMAKYRRERKQGE